MSETVRALYLFYSQFGMPAFTVDDVPDDQDLPYITYRWADSDWDQPISHYCIVYMRTDKNKILLDKAQEIKSAIGTGKILPCGERGFIVLHYENAEILHPSDDDPGVRGVYINMQMDILHS